MVTFFIQVKHFLLFLNYVSKMETVFFFRVAFSENETPPPSPANLPRSRAELDSPLCWADREMMNLQRGRV